MNVPGAFKPEKYYFAVILSIDELTFFFFSVSLCIHSWHHIIVQIQVSISILQLTVLKWWFNSMLRILRSDLCVRTAVVKLDNAF